MKLLVQFGAIIAKPVTSIAGSPFILRYVTARRARVIVVMNPLVGWFFDLIDGVERSYLSHRISPLAHELYL